MTTPQTKFYRADFAKGMYISVAALVRDPATGNLILADFTGPKQSVRSNVMQLKTRKTNHWMLGGSTKIDKVSGHITQQQDLPNGHTNWVIVSRQAIPQLLNPTQPTFFWDEHQAPARAYERKLSTKMPESFYPVFSATVNFPTLPQWADAIWQSQINYSSLILNIPDTRGVRAYRLLPNNDAWQETIARLFQDKLISIYDNQEPEPEPEPEPKPQAQQEPEEPQTTQEPQPQNEPINPFA